MIDFTISEADRRAVVAHVESLAPPGLHGLIAGLAVRERLAKLSNRELVARVLETDLPENLLVLEMMDRLDPEWSSEMRITD